MGYSQSFVTEKFVEGVTNKRASNFFSKGDALYSYGEHFTLAIRRAKEENLQNGKEWFLLNGDKYSITTSQHQGITFNHFSTSPRVAFSAIEAAGLDPRTCKLIDFTEDDYWHEDERWRNNKLPQENDVPMGAMKSYRDGLLIGYHKIGGCLLRGIPLLYKMDNLGLSTRKPIDIEKEYDFVCGMDEGSYFVSMLPSQVNSMADAFKLLQPQTVQDAYADKVEVLRQGEWFFVPMEWFNKFSNAMFKLKIIRSKMVPRFQLPINNEEQNRHICTRGLQQDGNIYVWGTVRHHDRMGVTTGEHKMLKIGKEIYVAFKNTSLGDWSSDGTVD